MNGRPKYFIFNKESDYRRGYLQNMTVERNGISAERSSKKKGVFLSRILDSQEIEMNWHRLCIRGNEKQQTAFRLSVYAGNQKS